MSTCVCAFGFFWWLCFNGYRQSTMATTLIMAGRTDEPKLLVYFLLTWSCWVQLSWLDLEWSTGPGHGMPSQWSYVVELLHCLEWWPTCHGEALLTATALRCLLLHIMVGWYVVSPNGYGLGLVVVVWWRRWMMAWWLHIHTNDDMMCGVVVGFVFIANISRYVCLPYSS